MIAHGVPRRACADAKWCPLVSDKGAAMLLVVEYAGSGSSDTVLRSLDELQPGGTINHVIPYRWGCAYTLFQGESAKHEPVQSYSSLTF